jgi:hypothetical protein
MSRIEQNRIDRYRAGRTLSFFSKETFMTHRDTHEHENNKVFSYQRTCAKKEKICPFRGSNPGGGVRGK